MYVTLFLIVLIDKVTPNTFLDSHPNFVKIEVGGKFIFFIIPTALNTVLKTHLIPWI